MAHSHFFLLSSQGRPVAHAPLCQVYWVFQLQPALVRRLVDVGSLDKRQPLSVLTRFLQHLQPRICCSLLGQSFRRGALLCLLSLLFLLLLLNPSTLPVFSANLLCPFPELQAGG